MRALAADFPQRLLPIAAAQGIGLSCGLAGVWLSSHWVEPADYGRYGVFVTLAPLGATVVFAGRVKWLSRHWLEAKDRPAVWQRSVAASARLGVVLAVACAAAAAVFAPGSRVAYGAILFASAALLAFVQLVQSALQAQRSHWTDCGVAITGATTRSFAPPLLYAATGGFSALLLGFLLHAFATSVAAAAVARRWWRRAGTPADVAESPTYRGPQFMLLAVASWVALGANRWIVAGWFGAEAAGQFTLAGAIGGVPATMLGAMLLQYFQPQWFAPDAGTRPHRQVDGVLLFYLAAGVAAAFALQAALPWFVAHGFVGERYAGARAWVLPAGCAAVATFAGNFHHALLLAARRERSCFPVDLTGIAIALGGSVAAAAIGEAWFRAWLTASPLVPVLVNRTLARRALARPHSP